MCFYFIFFFLFDDVEIEELEKWKKLKRDGKKERKVDDVMLRRRLSMQPIRHVTVKGIQSTTQNSNTLLTLDINTLKKKENDKKKTNGEFKTTKNASNDFITEKIAGSEVVSRDTVNKY